jgi:hypothetical protein
MNKYIWVTASHIGYHRWPGAPSEAQFLCFKHRHVFKFKACLRVDHGDRQKEFFIVQKALQVAITKLWPACWLADKDFGENSCEQIAEKLLCFYPDVISIEVSEDGENGAVVYAEGDEYETWERSQPKSSSTGGC